MIHRERTRVLALVLLLASRCATAVFTALPTHWTGPDTFRLNYIAIRPGMVLAEVETCQDPDGRWSETSIRTVGLRQTAQGLTEARYEVNGRPLMRMFFDETGTLKDFSAEDDRLQERMQPFVNLLQQGWSAVGEQFAGRELQRNIPIRAAPMMEKYMQAHLDAVKHEVFREWKVLDEELTFEYLGHTDYNGRRVAGHRLEGTVRATAQVHDGRVTAPTSLRFSSTRLTDHRGVSLLMDETVAAENRSGRWHRRCQTRFDAAASRGL